MKEEYLKVQVESGFAYIRVDCLDRLRDVDAAIFDCDGVLIDTRDSYRKSIVETVKYFFRELTGIKLSPDKVLMEATHLLKGSGGFNNDWDVAYTILLFLFRKMPNKFSNEFISLVRSENFLNEGILRKRFDYVKTSLRLKTSGFNLSLDDLANELKQFALGVDDSGIESVERRFASSEDKEIFSAVKRFLNYPGCAKESLLATVFDEMFYGSNLYEETYGRKRQFYDGVGFVEIESEKTVVTGELLDDLAKSLEKENFGIVSGRDRLSARFSLGKMLDKFRREAVIFLMDCNYPNKQAEEERLKLRKPNPYPLIKASKGLAPFKYSLYVGDSVEDIIMVRRANEICPIFISVGVYSFSDFKDELISYFFKSSIDIIAYSIKELPLVIREVKGRRI